jgi:lipopolysaccharide exporter
MHRHSRLDFRLQIHPQVRSEVLTYGLGATGNSLGYYLSANCDNFVVGKLLGASTLGYYSFAYQLTMVLPTMMSQAICQIWVSAFAQISEEQQQQELLVQVLEKTAFLAAPIHALFYLIIDKQVIALVFGDKWAPSAVVIPWLLIFAYSRLLNSLLGSMLSVKGRPEINAQVTLLIAPFAVCSFVIGAIYHGVIGVSIGVALVLGIVWTFYWWWLACRQLRWSLTQFLIPVVKPALIALMAVVISFIVPMSIKPFVFIFSYIILARFLAFDTFVELSKLIIKILKFQ